MKARFVLDKKKVVEQYQKLRKLGRVSYSFKTNRDVGKVLDEDTDSEFSIHNISEIDMLNPRRVWFFAQAWHEDDIKKILGKGVRSFVVDNEKDLDELLNVVNERVNLILRMKFQEHRMHAGKYFDYGMSARKVNEIISRIKDNEKIGKLGIHIHRKSQNASEWEIKQELEDSLERGVLERLDIINLGGGFPVKYRTYTAEVMDYIFSKVEEVKTWLKEQGKEIEVYLEPGRFIAAPAVKLETEVLQVYDGVIVVNTSIYNCALDTILTDIRMLVEGELENGDGYKIKGNSPTRDDIFRYKVKLKDVKVGDKLVFLNAGAYNYTTDFCGFEKLETIVV
ncbi:decarboxylase [Candidatus Pacearchaeota archaeon CG10_big_fil_rev_8_21_14_0_10_35_219]|nr:decarboxylase [Candidatus Pacearchaeota archaeon]OIO42064.1 MAG: hypothetical protein AUJ63_04195 [Candidatus Pacearchaeota archaeon CG1_02_35_32]PIO07615.1 MAG: decarboxylase [Candidatus Pacearchaeota archaeon CG10_big_fil_rev_8_21_14_0_10_35_219]PIY81147.1 MAG: decarboxylase [Candidatus Pacearchaeota archaeon CG_4_10_14_0_8_um_filter_35_169]PIZ79744.1 MAG: decarboxylase [Candidatus Pacearchaeota archaeon CG_4_10_14_0_2_um_filter_35_33]PJA70323.1 MAG: decarboxylase [Candidatus Pacearchaeot